MALIVVSGVSDVADGYIARRFHQITELGKVLDPIADKLTQIAVAFILCYTFTAIIPLVVVLVVKELLMLLLGLRMMRRGAKPISAKWWGKVSTSSFYLGVVIVMLFSDQLGGVGVTVISILISVLMLFSLFQYWREFQRLYDEGLNSYFGSWMAGVVAPSGFFASFTVRRGTESPPFPSYQKEFSIPGHIPAYMSRSRPIYGYCERSSLQEVF